jgi:hypothetical protein
MLSLSLLMSVTLLFANDCARSFGQPLRMCGLVLSHHSCAAQLTVLMVLQPRQQVFWPGFTLPNRMGEPPRLGMVYRAAPLIYRQIPHKFKKPNRNAYTISFDRYTDRYESGIPVGFVGLPVSLPMLPVLFS